MCLSLPLLKVEEEMAVCVKQVCVSLPPLKVRRNGGEGCVCVFFPPLRQGEVEEKACACSLPLLASIKPLFVIVHRGLVIPGQDNSVQVRSGSSLGVGIYVSPSAEFSSW